MLLHMRVRVIAHQGRCVLALRKTGSRIGITDDRRKAGLRRLPAVLRSAPVSAFGILLKIRFPATLIPRVTCALLHVRNLKVLRSAKYYLNHRHVTCDQSIPGPDWNARNHACKSNEFSALTTTGMDLSVARCCWKKTATKF